jgi:hypothetical protein
LASAGKRLQTQKLNGLQRTYPLLLSPFALKAAHHSNESISDGAGRWCKRTASAAITPTGPRLPKPSRPPLPQPNSWRFAPKPPVAAKVPALPCLKSRELTETQWINDVVRSRLRCRPIVRLHGFSRISESTSQFVEEDHPVHTNRFFARKCGSRNTSF